MLETETSGRSVSTCDWCLRTAEVTTYNDESWTTICDACNDAGQKAWDGMSKQEQDDMLEAS